MILPILLSTIQVASPSTMPVAPVVTPSMLARMDAVFAKPILAPFRASYLRERERGLIAETVAGYTSVKATDFQLAFYPGTNRIRVFRWGNFKPIVGRRLPTSLLMQAAESAIEQLSEEPRPDRRGEFPWYGGDGGNEFLAVARRRAYGLPVDDAFSVIVNAVDGTLLQFFNNAVAPLDVEPHGGDPIRPAEELRDVGYSQLIRDRPPFDQAELVKDETAIEPDYRNGHVAIPKHGMLWRSAEGSLYGVSIDARDGKVLGSRYSPTQGGRVSAISSSVPSRVRVGGIDGALTSLDKSATIMPEQIVAITSGKKLFLSRFDEKTGTLWLRRTKDEPYRAFRPDARLRKALATQVKRTEALGRKG